MLLVGWKQKNLLNEILTLESIAIEAMSGHKNNNNNDNDNVNDNDNENDNDKNNNFI